MVQTLDNLRRDGTLTIIDYLERLPDKLITRKQELIESLKKQAEKPAFSPESGGNVNKNGGGEDGVYVIGSELDAAKKVAQLPTSMQARYNDLPKVAQRALIK